MIWEVRFSRQWLWSLLSSRVWYCARHFILFCFYFVSIRPFFHPTLINSTASTTYPFIFNLFHFPSYNVLWIYFHYFYSCIYSNCLFSLTIFFPSYIFSLPLPLSGTHLLLLGATVFPCGTSFSLLYQNHFPPNSAHSSMLRMEAVCSFEKSVTIYQTTWSFL